MDPILFLDFDGVLHPDPCEVDEYFRRVPMLEEVLREFAPIQVVISSSWGQIHPLDELREFFADDLKDRVIDVTRGGLRMLEDQVPTELWNFVREAQCFVWIRENRPGVPWLALEDQAWRFDPASAHVLLIDGKTGITDADMQELRRRLRACVSTGGGTP